MLTVLTVSQVNFIQLLYSLPPHITVQMWRNFESFIKNSNENGMGCLYDSIIRPLPVRHRNFHDLCTLLPDGTQFFASTDGLVHDDLKSSSVGWLFWTEADDADFRTTDGALASPIVVLTCGTEIVHGRFDSITSYCAKGTGQLITPFIVAHLMKFLSLDSPPQITHNCDNQELINK